MGITFDCSKVEQGLAAQIAERAIELLVEEKHPVKRGVLADLEMDIIACHLNGCPLDLVRLRDADKGTFGHDVFGIRKYLDRNTGKLTNCFLPRCALDQ